MASRETDASESRRRAVSGAGIGLGLLSLATAWALFGSAAADDVLTLEATRDNTLFEDAQGDTSNGSGPSLFAGRISQGRVRRALVSFDVRSALPHGTVVDSVTLHLHLSGSSDPLPRAIRVHAVLADWGEGASASAGGSGAPAQDGDSVVCTAATNGTLFGEPRPGLPPWCSPPR